MRSSLPAAALVAGLFSAFPVAQSDPSPEIRALMNEPISMLDWGIYQLERMTEDDLKFHAVELGFAPEQIFVATDYDFARDEIQVGVITNLIRRSQPKADCRNLVNRVRESLAPREINKGPAKPNVLWANIFQHSGFTTNEKLDNELAVKLPKLVRIEATVWPAEKSGKPVKCSGRLLDDSLAFEE